MVMHAKKQRLPRWYLSNHKNDIDIQSSKDDMDSAAEAE